MMRTETDQRAGLQVYFLEGETTLDYLRAVADQLATDHHEHELRYALLDCADMHGALPVMALMEVGEYFAQALGGKVRLAAINPPTEWRNNEFSEDVMSNRGSTLRHFASREAAIDWLCSGAD